VILNENLGVYNLLSESRDLNFSGITMPFGNVTIIIY
jgi:hypothetical protein